MVGKIAIMNEPASELNDHTSAGDFAKARGAPKTEIDGRWMLRTIAPMGVAVLILGGALLASEMILQKAHSTQAPAQKVSGVELRK